MTWIRRFHSWARELGEHGADQHERAATEKYVHPSSAAFNTAK